MTAARQADFYGCFVARQSGRGTVCSGQVPTFRTIAIRQSVSDLKLLSVALPVITLPPKMSVGCQKGAPLMWIYELKNRFHNSDLSLISRERIAFRLT
jgi:hypothetical protein